jgi:hypothetical protein
MNDEFHLGEPARHPPRLGTPTRGRAGSSFGVRLVWIVAGLVFAGALAFVFLRSADEAGKQIAESHGTVGGAAVRSDPRDALHGERRHGGLRSVLVAASFGPQPQDGSGR